MKINIKDTTEKKPYQKKFNSNLNEEICVKFLH